MEKVNKIIDMIDKEVEEAKQINPIMGLAMLHIKRKIKEMFIHELK